LPLDFRRRQQTALTRLFTQGIIGVKKRQLKTIISKKGIALVALNIRD